MSTEYIERSTAIIDRIEGLALVPHAMRLLAEGEPVALDELAAAAGRHLLDGRTVFAWCAHARADPLPVANVVDRANERRI